MSSDPKQLEAALQDAELRVERAGVALRQTHHGGEVDEWRAAIDERTRLQRELGLARGEEVAQPFPWSHDWDRGAPMPHVVAASGGVFLVYYLRSGWNGHVRADDDTDLLALVNVKGCYCHRFGGPNDEVFDGHPLAQRGLDGYGAFVIENSRWVAEHQAINSVHSRYDPAHWQDRKHYFFAFHDEVFECIAEGFEVEVKQSKFVTVLQELIGQI